MKISDKKELQLFEDTLEQCDGSVLVLTNEGTQYDLMNPMEKHQGIARLIDEDAEVFATNRADEMKLLGYCRKVA